VPFQRGQAGIYAVVRHADVIEASRNPKLFSSEPAANMVIDMPPWLAPYFDSMINMDDPRHSTIRKVVARAFSPKLLAKLKATHVKLWIHAHECGHQFRGPDEETADCFAVQRGRRQGWLTPEGLEDVCAFMAPAKADGAHFTGAKRCLAMKECYADRSIR